MELESLSYFKPVKYDDDSIEEQKYLVVKSGELIGEPVTNLDLAIESATKNNGIVMDSITKKVVYPDPGTEIGEVDYNLIDEEMPEGVIRARKSIVRRLLSVVSMLKMLFMYFKNSSKK